MRVATPRHRACPKWRGPKLGNQPTALAAGQKSPAFPRQRPDASAFGWPKVHAIRACPGGSTASALLFAASASHTQDRWGLRCASSPATRPDSFRPNRRSGMSLLEVLISVAIFLGALTAIMQVLNVGQRAEVATRLQTEAILKCEAKMAEFISGIEEAASSQGGTFEDDETGNWKWDAEVTDSGIVSLLMVTVKVEHSISDDEANAAFTLSRYMRDPQLFIDAALSETAE